MSRRILAFALCLPLSAAMAAAQVSSPRLSYAGAPFVGQALTLNVEGAAPLSAIDLYFSPRAGSSPTPWGVLEVNRDEIHLVASGITSASGSWSHEMSIPLDRALAETPMHFQVLAHDPAAPSGRALSNAVHAQVLGSRVYGAYRGFGVRWGMYILSGVSESILARVDYGTPNDPGSGEILTGTPVFDAAHTSGAVLITSRELLFFDTSTGAVQGRVDFTGDCVSQLLTDAARQYVYLLQPGAAGSAKIRRVDFATRTEAAPFDLTNATSSRWARSRTGLSAFVGEIGVSGRAQLRQIQLDPPADLGAARVGTPATTEVGQIVYGAGHVFVWGGPEFQESVTRFRETPTGLVRTSVTLAPCGSGLLTAVIGADRLVAKKLGACGGTLPTGGAWEMPMSTLGPLVALPHPPFAPEFMIKEIEADGALAWFVASREIAHNIGLYRLDVATHSWTTMPAPDGWWNTAGPNDVEPLRDAWNHELWAATQAWLTPPGVFVPEIRVFDELTSTVRRIPLEHSIQALHAVPMP